MAMRQHLMPFGAEVQADGGVRFRLWAPAARQVKLCLVADGRTQDAVPMRSERGGWFSLTTGLAKAGSLYRYRIDEDLEVPDPASRCQPQDVLGPSQVVDARAFDWRDADWKGRPWEEAVFYELHVGTFTPEGTFTGVMKRLDHLVDLGVTAIELMPVADFPGGRNWGYDGVFPYAPENRYGRPEDLKTLVQAAHGKGLMVFLDVVYNHFGPEGNFLYRYAPQFFTERHHTPWGAAIDFDGPHSRTVRDFFMHNALYWLTEYQFDGLRLDAVHAILDDSRPHILIELAEKVRQGPGVSRRVHLVLENDHNAVHLLSRDQRGRAQWYDAQWNDDIHHALHVLITAETGGYYLDFAETPIDQLGRCLAEGFAFQGERSPYRGGSPRGEPSRDLPPTAFISLLQNHDQVGNRALGERINRLARPEAVRAATVILMLAPSPPLLFMGQEWATDSPFPFFCDFEPELARKVREGRRNELSKFPELRDPASRERIPDPGDPGTREAAILDWAKRENPDHREWLTMHRHLLRLRRDQIVPRLRGMQGGKANCRLLGDRALRVRWLLGDGSELSLVANLGDKPVQQAERPAGEVLFALAGSQAGSENAFHDGALPPWSVWWFLKPR